MSSLFEEPARASVRGAQELPPVLWIGLFILFSVSLQFIQPTWFDGDTGYHVAVGRLIREHGLLTAFPWTPFSIFSEKYADTELFFHFLFAATAMLEPDVSAKLVGILLEASLLSSLFFIVRQGGPRNAGFWMLLMLVLSAAFVVRFATVRPHLLAVELAILVLWSVVERRWLVMALSSALPGRRFMVALNPLLFAHKDQALYEAWLTTVYQPPPAPAALIRNRFDTPFVLCEARPWFRPFILAMVADPETRRYLTLGPWWLFEIRSADALP